MAPKVTCQFYFLLVIKAMAARIKAAREYRSRYYREVKQHKRDKVLRIHEMVNSNTIIIIDNKNGNAGDEMLIHGRWF